MNTSWEQPGPCFCFSGHFIKTAEKIVKKNVTNKVLWHGQSGRCWGSIFFSSSWGAAWLCSWVVKTLTSKGRGFICCSNWTAPERILAFYFSAFRDQWCLSHTISKASVGEYFDLPEEWVWGKVASSGSSTLHSTSNISIIFSSFSLQTWGWNLNFHLKQKQKLCFWHDRVMLGDRLSLSSLYHQYSP